MFRVLILLMVILTQGLAEYNLIQVTPPYNHSEGPSWDSRKGLLYFVDLYGHYVRTYNPKTGEVKSVKVDGTVSPVLQTKNPNLLIIGLNRSIGVIEWDGVSDNLSFKKTKIYATVSDRFPESHMNDGKADKKGRVWIGTMGATEDIYNEGALYRIENGGIRNPKVQVQPVSISNGLCWSKDNTKFYYIDSLSHEIVVYDYRLKSGRISNRKVVFDVRKHNLEGIPDGMTIDKDDTLWVAIPFTSKVINVNPKNGELIRSIKFPTTLVTSATWGGSNLDVLYVTTSRYSLTSDEIKEQPAAGSVFAVTDLGTSGLPINLANVF